MAEPVDPQVGGPAADFASDLDDAAESERENMIRHALTCAVDTHDYLDSDVAVHAVAAAALVAAQCPGGQPVTSAYGPDQPLPHLAADLRALAVQALNRVETAPSELLELWEEATAPGPWRATIDHLRAPLLPPPPGQQLHRVCQPDG